MENADPIQTTIDQARQFHALESFDPPKLEGINHPTLIVHGKEDKICSLEEAKQLAGVIPNAELVVWLRTAHAILAESANKVVDTIHDHFGVTNPNATIPKARL